MSDDIFADDRDDELRRALGDALPEPPIGDVDWAALQARITKAATPLLQPRLPRESDDASWWQPLARWSPRGIPLAAAASAVLMLGAAWLGTGRAVAAGDAFLMVEEALVDGAAFPAQPLLAGVDEDDMIDAALFLPEDGW